LEKSFKAARAAAGGRKNRLQHLQSESVRPATSRPQNQQPFGLLRKTIYAVEIEGDLRAAFYVEGETAFTVDIGSHAIYRV
jgi:hypothetical protein